MSLYRTFLFVPGSNFNWFQKLCNYDADNLILDLEDSVPLAQKSEARNYISNAISDLTKQSQRVYVRINRGDMLYDQDDLNAVIQPDLKGLVLPKVEDPQDIIQISNEIYKLEENKNMQPGSVKLLPILETAKSMYFAYEIAVKERVVAIASLTAKDGDVQRAVNYQWTPEGLETLYIRSKAVLAARAAGVIPIGGLWQDVHNLEGLKNNTLFNRQLGFDGEMVLHPSNIPIVNSIYSPTKEEISYYKGMIDAFEKAEGSGLNTAIYKGNHIDMAHIKTAKKMLAYSDSIKH
jgi:citrate lyase subunit beta/citryl-CoA lyase